MADHCMHGGWIDGGWIGDGSMDKRRMCCWCGMQQVPVPNQNRAHGPFVLGTNDWHWEPRSTTGDCTREGPTA